MLKERKLNAGENVKLKVWTEILILSKYCDYYTCAEKV